MSGSNANFRNYATDKDYTLRKDAGHLSAAVFSKAPPQQGLNSIACGEIKQDALTESTFKSAFRFDDLVANQRYYSVFFTFREDIANADVKVYVRSTSFKPWVTVWRNASNKFQVDKELSSDGELVVPVDVTDELTGPFIIEVSSEDPYTTGDFEVELRCGEVATPLTGFIYPGVRDYGYTFDIFAFSGTIVIIPPTRGYTVFHYSFPSDYHLIGYTWSVVSGSLGGLALSSFGILSGVVTQEPDWTTFPLDGKFPWPVRPGIPAHVDWVDSMYSSPWRGFARNGGIVTGPFMNIHFIANIATLGFATPIGNRVISVPILIDFINIVATFSPPDSVIVPVITENNPWVVNKMSGLALVSQVGSQIGFRYSTFFVDSIGNIKGYVHVGFTPNLGWNAVVSLNVLYGGDAATVYFRSNYNATMGSFTLDYIGKSSSGAGYSPDIIGLFLDSSINPPVFDDIGDLTGGGGTISAN